MLHSGRQLRQSIANAGGVATNVPGGAFTAGNTQISVTGPGNALAGVNSGANPAGSFVNTVAGE